MSFSTADAESPGKTCTEMAAGITTRTETRAAVEAAGVSRAESWDEERTMKIDYAHPSDRERTAVHEAGHALVTTLCSALPRVASVSLGATLAGGGICNTETLDPTLPGDWD